MHRRTVLQLSFMTALSAGTSALALPVRSISEKKGLGITTKSLNWADKLTALRVKWFYTWNSKLPDGIPHGIQFIPMIWGPWETSDAIAGAAESAKAAGIRELLGFNEPDQKKQANMSVEKALANWSVLMETGLRLGSPGCVHPDGEWMKAFMPAAEKRKLRIDFVCMHNYGGPNPDALINRLEKVHKLYRKPIWLTEFAVGDWNAKTADRNRHKQESVLQFMEKVLPRLEKLDFLERYAWFPAEPDSAPLGTSALFDESGNLTRLGECYRDM